MRIQRVVFVPEWIDRVIKRNSLKLEDLLYFERIQSVFSKSDLCSLVSLAGLVPQLIGTDSIQPEIIDLQEHWLRNLKQEQQSLRSVIESYTSLLKVHSGADTLNRIYGEQSLNTSGGTTPMYESFLVGDSYIFVVVNTGYQAGDYVRTCSELIRDIAKKHYVYEEHHELMCRSIGGAYVESLSR